MDNTLKKPLGGKAYGSTPHLIGSRLGPGDHRVHEGQHQICCGKPRKGWRINVTEKLDGCCVAVARDGRDLIALGRVGYLAEDSKFEHVRAFGLWLRRHEEVFKDLRCGERLVGEWLALAHGTRYRLMHAPFVPFALFDGKGEGSRRPVGEMRDRAADMGLPLPHQIAEGPITPEEALAALGDHGFHGAIELPEGAVWVVERDGRYQFAAKYVRAEKQDGALLPEISGGPAVWNWRP